MRTVLISYSNKKFYKSQKKLSESALANGIDEVIEYNDIWLKRQKKFYNKNKNILDSARGAGYWLWKPFILLDALEKIGDDDILIHIDAGATFTSNISQIKSLVAEKGLLLFYNNNNINKVWTKRDCFHYMKCDTEKFHLPSQLLAGYIFCMKNEFNISLFKEWLEFAQDERIISDNPNECGLQNYSEFIDHRHDQSILTNLAIKYNIELFRDPSQWGNKYKTENFKVENEFVEDGYSDKPFINSPYPTLLNSHRLKLKLNLADRWSYFKLKLTNGGI